MPRAEDHGFFSWIETLIGGVLERHLPQIQIVQPDGLILEGSGRIKWNAAKELLIEACTSKVPGLDPHKVYGRVGEMVQESDLSSVTGITAEGVHFQARAIQRRTGGVDRSSEWFTWSFNPHAIEFFDPAPFLVLPFDLYEITALLKGFDFELWSDSCYRKEDGNSSVKMRFRQEEFEAVCETCRLCVTDQKNKDLRVRVEVGLEKQDHLREAFENAFAALCFFSGRRLGLPGWEITEGRKRRLILRGSIRLPRDDVYPPFGYGGFHNIVWPEVAFPLKLAVNFFGTPNGRRIRNLLYLWWDSADVMPSARILILTSLIEGICNVLAGQRGKGDMGTANIQTILGEWREFGRYPVAKEDLKVFKRRRHPAAHGSFVTSLAEHESLIRDEARLASLLNRILLKAMGYTGPCARYDLAGWPLGDMETKQSIQGLKDPE